MEVPDSASDMLDKHIGMAVDEMINREIPEILEDLVWWCEPREGQFAATAEWVQLTGPGGVMKITIPIFEVIKEELAMDVRDRRSDPEFGKPTIDAWEAFANDLDKMAAHIRREINPPDCAPQ